MSHVSDPVGSKTVLDRLCLLARRFRMYRSIDPICQSLFIYMVSLTSCQASLSEAARNTHAYRDGTSDERRFHGLCSANENRIHSLRGFSPCRINGTPIRSNGQSEF